MQFHPFTIFGQKVRSGVLQANILDELTFAPQTVGQVHGDKILEVKELSEEIEGYDAMVTEKTGIVLMIKTADCIPLVLADEEAGIAAAVHAGWRGLTKDIVPKTVKKMIKMGAKASRIKVGIGPSIGLCCSTFSDPLKEIPRKYHFAIDGHKVDLNGICDFQLAQVGVKEKNVERMDICTCCNEEWFSHRRDEDKRRFGTLIELTEEMFYIEFSLVEEVEVVN
ncbi:polyphenol oxidase family protein [Patescibacteria group bacterium]|nr:polyphenol oxidase family protein [Patescibacteria group bacterium]